MFPPAPAPAPPQYFLTRPDQTPITFDPNKLKEPRIITVFKDGTEYQAITVGDGKTLVLRQVNADGILSDQYTLHHFDGAAWKKSTPTSEAALKTALATALGVAPADFDAQYQKKWGLQWVGPAELKTNACQWIGIDPNLIPNSFFKIDGRLPIPKDRPELALPRKTRTLLAELALIHGASSKKLGELFDLSLTATLADKNGVIRAIVNANAVKNQTTIDTLFNGSILKALFENITTRPGNQEFAFSNPNSRKMHFELSTFLASGFPSLERTMRFLAEHTTFSGPEHEPFRRTLAQQMMDTIAAENRRLAGELKTVFNKQPYSSTTDFGTPAPYALVTRTNRQLGIKRTEVDNIYHQAATLHAKIVAILPGTPQTEQLLQQVASLNRMLEKGLYSLPNYFNENKKTALLALATREIDALNLWADNPTDESAKNKAEAASYSTLNYFLNWLKPHLKPDPEEKPGFRTDLDTVCRDLMAHNYSQVDLQTLFFQINGWLRINTSQMITAATTATENFENAFLKQEDVIGADLEQYEITRAALEKKSREIETLLQVIMYARALYFRHLGKTVPALEKRAETLQALYERIDLALKVAPTTGERLQRAYATTIEASGKETTCRSFDDLVEHSKKHAGREYKDGAKTSIQYSKERGGRKKGVARIQNGSPEKMEISIQKSTKELVRNMGSGKTYKVDFPYDIQAAAFAFNCLVANGVPSGNIRVNSLMDTNKMYQYLWPETLNKFTPEDFERLPPRALEYIPNSKLHSLGEHTKSDPVITKEQGAREAEETYQKSPFQVSRF